MNSSNSVEPRYLRSTSGGWLDVVGAAASWTCAIHCIALPFAVSLLPLIGLSFLLSESIERIFIGISIVIAGLSLMPAYFRQHGKAGALLLFTSGIGLIIFSTCCWRKASSSKRSFCSRAEP